MGYDGETDISEKMIEMSQVCVVYPNGTKALQDCSFYLEKGEFVFVVGSSGSGKSTLIKTILGEVHPKSGKVVAASEDLGKISAKQLPYFRRKMGVVFQDFRLLDDRNVFENVALAQHVIGVGKDRIKKNVDAMLEMVGLSDKGRVYPKELSGGEKQRVAIARAMVNRPSLLLADEPTGNLDPSNSREIMKLLSDVNKLGTTVLVVTHNHEIIKQMKKRVITIDGGKVVGDRMLVQQM